MNKQNPSKYIRKAIYTAINNITVNGLQIPCYDTRVKLGDNPMYYVLMTTQSKTVNKATKCEYRWSASLLLDIVTKYNVSGNTGSRLLADDIENAIREATKDLTIEGFHVVFMDMDFPDNLDNINEHNIVYRNFIRYTFELN